MAKIFVLADTEMKGKNMLIVDSYTYGEGDFRLLNETEKELVPDWNFYSMEYEGSIMKSTNIENDFNLHLSKENNHPELKLGLLIISSQIVFGKIKEDDTLYRGEDMVEKLSEYFSLYREAGINNDECPEYNESYSIIVCKPGAIIVPAGMDSRIFKFTEKGWFIEDNTTHPVEGVDRYEVIV